MKRILLIILALILVACSSNAKAYEGKKFDISKDSSKQERSDIDQLRKFSFDTTKLIMKEDENQNFSPLSLYIALAMATEGSDNATAEELKDFLDFKGTNDELSQLVRKIYSSIVQDNEDGKVFLANSLWIKENFPVSKEYVKVINEKYFADVYSESFDESTAKKMTEWVEKNTNGLLKPEYKLSQNTVMSIMNALYFESAWQNDFDARATSDEDFMTFSGELVKKPMMKHTEHSSIIQKDGFIGTQLYFKNGYKMTLLMNEKETSLEGALDTLENLKEEDFTSAKIDLWLPKFTIERNYDLKDALQQKMTTPFSESANFSKISSKKTFISKIMQDTIIEVDEKGVKAAAVTKIDIETTAAPNPEEPVELHFDKPFLYTIESPDGTILFVGTLVK